MTERDQSMIFSGLTYTPRPYSDLKAKSFAFAAGIEAMAPKLPPFPQEVWKYSPKVKWILIPFHNRDPEDNGFLSRCIQDLNALCKEVLPHIWACAMGEDYGSAIWAWEPVRPNSGWVRVRLPQMYLLARAALCHLEAWTYEDEDAWSFGLNNLINEAGFDRQYTRPGQMS